MGIYTDAIEMNCDRNAFKPCLNRPLDALLKADQSIQGVKITFQPVTSVERAYNN